MFQRMTDTVYTYYHEFTRFLEKTCLWKLEALIKIMPYKIDLPRHSNARAHILEDLCETCERRAVALFQALTWLLPLPLLALYLTAKFDGTLIFLMMARFVVDGEVKWFKWLSNGKKPAIEDDINSISIRRTVSTDRVPVVNGVGPRASTSPHMSANGLAVFGVFIHTFQFFYFFNQIDLISSPYGFCSNIFVFLVTGFTCYSFWCTVVLCIVKNFAISLIYLTSKPSLTDTEIEYFYGYWCSCAIVLTVLTPVHLETIGRIIAEGQATTFKKHMNELLRASFDACVWVNDKLCVLEADPKLDAMFMRSMKRESLLEYVHLPESSQFESNVCVSIENHSTSLHHVTFRTFEIGAATEQIFDVDLYITSKLSYWSRDDRNHLVGIRLRSANSPDQIDDSKRGELLEMNSSAEKTRFSLSRHLAAETATNSEEEPNTMVSNNSWECPECHCVNFGGLNNPLADCILCGFRGPIDFGCRTIHEQNSELMFHHPESEISSVWD